MAVKEQRCFLTLFHVLSTKRGVEMLRNRKFVTFCGIAIVLAILVGSVSVANAQYYWATSASKNWNSTYGTMTAYYYWATSSGPVMTGSGLPTSSTIVYVGDGGTVAVNAADVASSIYIGTSGVTDSGTGTVNINAASTLTVGGTLYLGNATNAGTLGIAGTLILGPGGIVTAGTHALNVNGSGVTGTINTNGFNVTYADPIGETGGTGNTLAKSGAGTLTLSGANSYTGGTSVLGGTLLANFTTNSGVLSSGPLTLQGGGTLQLLGNSAGTTQYMGNLTVNSGGGAIVLQTQGAGTTTLNLATITATTVGSSLLVNAPANTAVTTSSNVGGNGIYGGRAVFTSDGVNYNWATTVSGGAPYTLSANGTYVNLASSVLSTDNARIQSNEVLGAAPQTVNTLKIEGASSLDLNTQTLTINGGGLLVTGANPVTISDGNLTAGSAGIGGVNNELIIQQYNTGNLTISAAITDNGTPTSVTKAGPGTTILTGANLYTGTTTVGSGTLVAPTTSVLPFSVFTTTGQLSVAAGATFQFNYGGPSDWIAANVANLFSKATLASGSTIAFDTSNAVSGGTYTTVMTGSYSLMKVGTGALYLGTSLRTPTIPTPATQRLCPVLWKSARQPHSTTSRSAPSGACISTAAACRPATPPPTRLPLPRIHIISVDRSVSATPSTAARARWG